MNTKNWPDYVFVSSRLGKGGAEKHLLRLVNELSQNKNIVRLYLTQQNGDYEKFLHNDIQLIHLSRVKSSYLLSLVYSSFTLTKEFNNGNFRTVTAIQDGPILMTLLSKIFSRHAVNVYGWVQNNPNHLKKSFGTLPYYIGARILFGGLKKLIALSEGVKKEYNKMIPSISNKSVVINNIGFPESTENNNSIDGHQLDKSKFNLVACGRLTKQKNYFMMLEALQLALKKEKNLHLTIIGEGELKSSIQNHINSHKIAPYVAFLGFIPYPEAIIKQSSIFLLSSDFEGFGNVIVEAMSSGTPVISTDCPHGPSEIITNGVNGVLVEVGDSVAMAEAILELLNSKSKYELIAKNALKRANDFTAAKIGKKFIELIQSEN